MPQVVTTGAMLMCSFGVAPSTLNVLPDKMVMAENKPAATIMDAKPIVNIPPFGMCTTPSNPTVAAATAAALGVLTPMPCVPVTSAWIPGSPMALLGNVPMLNNTCQAICSYGGVITIGFPGATTTMVT